jgi:hypothetical protein
MTDEEMIAILEEIALDPDAYPTSRVTAIRTLWQWRHAEPEEEPTGFDELYDTDELRARRRVAAQREKRR